MAELPRYRRQAILTQGTEANYGPLRGETGRYFATLDNALGRMAAFAFGQAEEEMREKGLQYGAENPVTTEQLRDTIKEGKDPAELFAKNRGALGIKTAFGEAAREAQVFGLTSDIQLEAQGRIAALSQGVEKGEIPLAKARDELDGMVEGYSGSLRAVDPKAALKLRASLAVAANSAFLQITNNVAKQQAELRKVALDGWINNTLPGIVQSHIDAGTTMDPTTGAKVTSAQRIETLRPVLMGQLAQIGDDAYARQALEKFDKTITRAKVNAVSQFVAQDAFMRDPSGALSKIRNGELGAMSDVYASLPEDDKERVRRNFMEEAGRVHTLTERTVKQAEDVARNEVFTMLSRYWQMPDGAAKELLRNQIVQRGRGVMTFEQLHGMLKPQETTENIQAEIVAVDMVRRQGVNDLAEIQRRVPGLAPKQVKRIQDMIFDAGDRQLRETVKTLAGIPDGLVQLTGDQQRRYQALTAEAERLKSEAIAKDGSYSPSVIAGKLVEAKDRLTASKAADNAKAVLEQLGAERKAVLSESTSDAELRRLGYTGPQIVEIQRQQRILRGGQ